MRHDSQTSTTRRRLLAAGVALAATFAGFAGAAHAQGGYPTKPITLIVPFSAGGTTDILARIVGLQLGKALGQPVVIDNRPGAGGNIGASLAAKAPGDGYTLFMGTIGTHAINQSLYSKLPYDPVKDFAPITRVAMVPNLVVVNPKVPVNNVKELIAYVKANPDKLSYGSSGSGSSMHLSGELFNSMTGLHIQHIPYKGSAPAVNDLLGNQIGLMFDNMPSSYPHVKAGKLRALAVTSAKRSPALPNVPTVAESGVPGYEATSWFALYATGGTPQPIVDRLNAEVVKILAMPEVKKQMADQGAEPNPEKPAQLAAFMKSETAKWAKVVKASGATVD
ncbi:MULTISPECIES: tripartite tricarboxylate transporter substrate binding protein [unclassified Cupriavidus]|uniref:Bug family tripartite tricarboxylate transporter substrate binding protein n=1 Tax=unclassified Cupriavidus TaxID=2640874 RepID=UPI001AE1E5C7|nr:MULTISPECIES: tripartite tricarboxylate transporter substrate binding protein [unclassified Cupriavidus]MBP0629582.1 tripartite tricarboxylate transporter substrate binding protein [Cupriavidus sp. AcVe19-1a]MBP0639241.1 tripartite tricarboxylate transporter substrate binding protein [Cupriavidus sp. AcVe19-6a]